MRYTQWLCSDHATEPANIGGVPVAGALFLISMSVIACDAGPSGSEPSSGAMIMSDTVSVSLVIDKKARTPEKIERVKSILTSLGAESIVSGAATVTCKLIPERFEEVFGVKVEAVPPVESGDYDFGSPGGYVTRGELSIPRGLADYVTSASVEPPAKRLNE